MEEHVVTRVTGRIGAPAWRVWEYMSWQGGRHLRGVSVIDHVTIEDEIDGPGSVRTLHLTDGSKVSEYVESMSHEERWFVYKPTELGSLPVKDYTGRVEVVEEGPDCCQVVIESRCVPTGISAAEWQKIYRDLESAVIGYVKERVEPR